MFAAGQRENDFTVSGTVFLAVTGALLAVILILTFMIAAIVFASVKSRYYRENKNNNCKRHSIAGELALLYFFDIICMGLQCFTHVELNMCITIHAHTAVAPLFIMKPSQVCKAFEPAFKRICLLDFPRLGEGKEGLTSRAIQSCCKCGYFV